MGVTAIENYVYWSITEIRSLVFSDIFIDDFKEGLNKRMTGIRKNDMKLKGITNIRET